MDYEDMKFNEFNWKKWLKMGIGVVIGLFIIRTIVFTLFFGEAISFVRGFNREFVSGQEAIQNKIEAEQADFERRAAKFDRTHDQISKDFQELHESFQKGWRKHGKELADQVVEAKKEYEDKLIDCKAEPECQKYLIN